MRTWVQNPRAHLKNTSTPTQVCCYPPLTPGLEGKQQGALGAWLTGQCQVNQIPATEEMEKPWKKIPTSGISAGLHSQYPCRHVHSDVCITSHTQIVLETLMFSRQHKGHSFINWRDRDLQNELKISKILKFLPENINLWLNFEISFSSWFGNKETAGNVLNSLSKCQFFHHTLQPKGTWPVTEEPWMGRAHLWMHLHWRTGRCRDHHILRCPRYNCVRRGISICSISRTQPMPLPEKSLRGTKEWAYPL